MPAAKIEARRAADVLEALLAVPEPLTLETRMTYIVELLQATARLQLLMLNLER